MAKEQLRNAPGQVRDAILHVLSLTSHPLSVREIENYVCQMIGPTPTSSVRSYLCLNTPDLFVREARGVYTVQTMAKRGVQQKLFETQTWLYPVKFDKAMIFHADCFDWIGQQEDNSIHAVVTDPP